jgi:hypothetical protein
VNVRPGSHNPHSPEPWGRVAVERLLGLSEIQRVRILPRRGDREATHPSRGAQPAANEMLGPTPTVRRTGTELAGFAAAGAPWGDLGWVCSIDGGEL